MIDSPPSDEKEGDQASPPTRKRSLSISTEGDAGNSADNGGEQAESKRAPKTHQKTFSISKYHLPEDLYGAAIEFLCTAGVEEAERRLREEILPIFGREAPYRWEKIVDQLRQNVYVRTVTFAPLLCKHVHPSKRQGAVVHLFNYLCYANFELVCKGFDSMSHAEARDETQGVELIVLNNTELMGERMYHMKICGTSTKWKDSKVVSELLAKRRKAEADDKLGC
ncbi:hypothetical protein K432DRAFT_410682 [Lepidopterella palustris CBS 459.81]|uniref:Uncharacterized protein n=1 Tax=Lepidopterella palustris CBS 459.81 TaxID=1314670 RepID=A0A8E2DXN1_9PEZI|nr:hypothetical protein K432DRAFT_410682 [Lepidopterella palustris CBS 459.81]